VLITQRRRATPRRPGTWPKRGATASRKPASGALRGARSQPAHALAAPMARVIALIALTALELSGDPVHEPVHAEALRPPPLLLLWVTSLRSRRSQRSTASGYAAGRLADCDYRSPAGPLQRGGGGGGLVRGRSGFSTGRGRSQGSYTHAGSGFGGGQHRSISARNAASRERSRAAAG
jgi:hypothetical protein